MRVEKSEDLKQELQETKKELAAQIHQETKKGHPILTCLLVVVLVLLVLLGLVGYWLSLTGFVRVPFFSDQFYQAPEPTYEVQPYGQAIDAYISDELTEEINERVQATGSAEIDRNVSLLIENEHFTGTLRTYAGQESKYVDASRAQVAAIVEDGALEVFVPLANSKQKTAVVFDLLPSVGGDGLLVVELTNMRLGQLHLPDWFSHTFVKRPIEFAVNELNKNIGKYASLEKVEVVEEGLEMTGEISAEIIQLES